MYPGVHFRDYAVLGDEVVIADAKVASVYASVLGSFNIEMKILNIQHGVYRVC